MMNEVEEVSRESRRVIDQQLAVLGLGLGLFKVMNEVEEFSRESR